MKAEKVPKISILLPVRDAAQTLEETLISLKSQTFEDFELVLVNDGSTDETAAIAKHWFVGDDRLRILEPQGGPGLVPA